jgi:hypothetical protein
VQREKSLNLGRGIRKSKVENQREWFAADALHGFEAEPPPGPPWRPLGRGALLLPHDAGTDGMYVLVLRAPAASR